MQHLSTLGNKTSHVTKIVINVYASRVTIYSISTEVLAMLYWPKNVPVSFLVNNHKIQYVCWLKKEKKNQLEQLL